MVRSIIHLHSALALSTEGEPPEWVQLVPPGTFRGVDGRGPYTAKPSSVIANSLQHLPAVLDEVHATDLAAKAGIAAPARGWIVELQDRGDGAEGGVWGRVDWTPSGLQLMRERAYRGLSPALAVSEKGGVVLAVLRASLTNTPNLPIKPLLHSEQGTSMDLMDYLRQLLGLEAGADDATIRATLQAMIGDRTLQSSLREALDLAKDAKAGDVLTALQSRLSEAGRAKELQQTVTQLQTQVTELETKQKRTAAEAAVDAAIRGGKAAVNAERGRFITLHMQDPATAQALMDAIPSLHTGGLPDRPAGPPASADLTAEDQAVIALMGIDAEAFKKQRALGTGPVEIVTGTEA